MIHCELFVGFRVAAGNPLQKSYLCGKGITPGLIVFVLTIIATGTSAQEFGKRALYIDDGLQHFATACHPQRMPLPAGYMTSLPIGFKPDPGSTVDEDPRPSAFRRLGIYSAEFGPGVLGSTIASVGAYRIEEHLLDVYGGSEFEWLSALAMLGSYLLANPFLSAGGTHLGGKLFGQRGSFWHGYIGATIGGSVGFVLAIDNMHCLLTKESPVSIAVLIGCAAVPTALGAVIGYNIGR